MSYKIVNFTFDAMDVKKANHLHLPNRVPGEPFETAVTTPLLSFIITFIQRPYFMPIGRRDCGKVLLVTAFFSVKCC